MRLWMRSVYAAIVTNVALVIAAASAAAFFMRTTDPAQSAGLRLFCAPSRATLSYNPGCRLRSERNANAARAKARFTVLAPRSARGSGSTGMVAAAEAVATKCRPARCCGRLRGRTSRTHHRLRAERGAKIVKRASARDTFTTPSAVRPPPPRPGFRGYRRGRGWFRWR